MNCSQDITPRHDPASLLWPSQAEHVDLTEDSAVSSSDEGSTITSNTWLSTPLYTLHADKKQEILSPDGWLSVIKAAQLLISQEFPHIAGLQDPAVHKSLSFQILRENLSRSFLLESVTGVLFPTLDVMMEWSMCTTTCTPVFPSVEQLVVIMMDVGRQSNSSDCGVLAIAFACDICSGNDPCKIEYDHRSIRWHLADCLEKCCLYRFPVVLDCRTQRY